MHTLPCAPVLFTGWCMVASISQDDDFALRHDADPQLRVLLVGLYILPLYLCMCMQAAWTQPPGWQQLGGVRSVWTDCRGGGTQLRPAAGAGSCAVTCSCAVNCLCSVVQDEAVVGMLLFGLQLPRTAVAIGWLRIA